MGTGVAPGVRHDPVFGSPGEEFPPLHPCPVPPPPDQHSPWSQGHLLGSLKQGGSATQPSAAGAWRKDRGKPCLRTRQGGARQGSAQKKGREGEDTSPRSWPPAKAWKGEYLGTPASFWGLAGTPAHPSVAPGAHQVTRILCFGMTLG